MTRKCVVSLQEKLKNVKWQLCDFSIAEETGKHDVHFMPHSFPSVSQTFCITLDYVNYVPSLQQYLVLVLFCFIFLCL